MMWCLNSKVRIHNVCMLQAMDQVIGKNGLFLPWEDPEKQPMVEARLGIFKTVLLELLARDPNSRPTMDHFCRACSRVFQSRNSRTISADLATKVYIRAHCRVLLSTTLQPSVPNLHYRFCCR